MTTANACILRRAYTGEGGSARRAGRAETASGAPPGDAVS